MRGDGRTEGLGNRPPWYVFVLAALGILLVLTAVVGVGPRSSSAPAYTPEPVPQPYRGPDTPTATSLLGDPTSVTVTTTTTPGSVRRVIAPVITTTPPPPTTTSTTTTRRTTTIVFPDPGNPSYCCWDGGYGGGGRRHP